MTPDNIQQTIPEAQVPNTDVQQPKEVVLTDIPVPGRQEVKALVHACDSWIDDNSPAPWEGR